MINNAKNGLIKIDDSDVYYLTFGKGKKNLIIIPGVGDGFKTVKGMALIFSFLYRKYIKDYQVYVFSRRNHLKEGFTINDMAKDLINHMEKLGITKADIVGVSQGGMIAQSVALLDPNKVNKLVLVVTVPRPNEILTSSITKWIKMAEEKNYQGIMLDSLEKSYTEKYANKQKKYYKFLTFVGKNASFERFIIEAKACLNFNVYNELSNIKCPTLIVGAGKDKVLGIEGSNELHKKIKNSELYVYDKYSHGVYEEAKDFNDRIISFLEK